MTKEYSGWGSGECRCMRNPTFRSFLCFFRRGAILVGNSTFVCMLSTAHCCSLPTYRCSDSGSSAAAHFSQSFPCQEGRETSQALHNPENSIAKAGMYFCTRQTEMTWAHSLLFSSLKHTDRQTQTHTHAHFFMFLPSLHFSSHWAGCYNSVFENLRLFISSRASFHTFQLALHLHCIPTLLEYCLRRRQMMAPPTMHCILGMDAEIWTINMSTILKYNLFCC